MSLTATLLFNHKNLKVAVVRTLKIYSGFWAMKDDLFLEGAVNANIDTKEYRT